MVQLTILISQELVCGVLDASGGRTVLQVVEQYLRLVMVPALTCGQKWGPLSQEHVNEFMLLLQSFTNFLSSELRLTQVATMCY